MADRKGRSVPFKLLRKTSVGRIKSGISDEIADGITVFQDLGNNEFLIELQTIWMRCMCAVILLMDFTRTLVSWVSVPTSMMWMSRTVFLNLGKSKAKLSD